MKLLRRYAALGAVLALTTVAIPDAGSQVMHSALVKVERAKAVDHPKNVVWILAMGSDARPGDRMTRSRADAIQLVGLNLDTGHGVTFGVPRDSWVPIPGHGSSRVNAALFFGGPQLMAQTVGAMFGIDIDYAFVTGFNGLSDMVNRIGGVTVRSRLAFSDDNLPGRFRVGKNRVMGPMAVNFARMRHFLPRGDFDRSANQGLLIQAIARKVHANQHRPGFVESALVTVAKSMATDLSPVELYRLAQAATEIDPGKLRACVLNGSIGNVGGASIVFPDLRQARRLADETRRDATLKGSC